MCGSRAAEITSCSDHLGVKMKPNMVQKSSDDTTLVEAENNNKNCLYVSTRSAHVTRGYSSGY